jgi:hypothetical protein
MGEYQYYEFVATDRPLDDRQLDDLRSLSTRAVITRTSFVNEYHWGNFRGDPLVLMERYFDAFLDLANWGARKVMIRVPARLLTLDAAQQYLVGDAVSARLGGDQVILCMTSEDDAGDWEQGGGGWLSSIIPARAELAAGDLRALYLAWLLSAQTELDDEEIEPPVPPGSRASRPPRRMPFYSSSSATMTGICGHSCCAASTTQARPDPVWGSAPYGSCWPPRLPDARCESCRPTEHVQSKPPASSSRRRSLGRNTWSPWRRRRMTSGTG